MIVFPLCLLGILETNDAEKKLVMLGRWGHSNISINSQLNPSEQVSNNSNNLITVTSNFEVILQSQSPEGRALAFHLREFCEFHGKSDLNVDPYKSLSSQGQALLDLLEQETILGKRLLLYLLTLLFHQIFQIMSNMN